MHSCTHSGHGNHNRNEEVCNPCPHIESQNCHCNDECACGVAARHTVGLAVLCKNRRNSVPHIRAFFFYDNSQKCYSKKHPRRHSQRLKKQIFLPQKCIYKQNRIACKYCQRKNFIYEFQHIFCGFVILEEIGQFNILFTVNFLHLPMLFTLRF